MAISAILILHNSKHLWKLSSLLSFIHHFVENCVYKYTDQPPASLDCNLEEQIQLKCKVTGPHNSHDPLLGIRWFHNSEQLQNNSTFTLTSLSEANNITSILTVKNWESNQGSYRCQLSINGNTSQTIPSVSLVLDGQLNSPGLPDCPSNTFFQMKPSCATVPITRLSSPSVTPTPMLLITSTTQTLVTSHTSLLPTPSPTVTTVDVGLYVVVTVAAVFAMIIIIPVIMCVGLCLRKSKTGDLETPKRK